MRNYEEGNINYDVNYHYPLFLQLKMIMMKKDYSELIGKTKKEILETIKENQFNDPHADAWVFYLEKSNFWKKKYLYLLFEDNIVSQSNIVYKFFWDKKY